LRLPKRSWASGALVAAALLAGCGGGGGEEGDAALAVYVSLPPSGDGADAADGARMALADAGGEAAGVPVTAHFLDAWGDEDRWTPQRAAANARTATQDSTAIGYLGDFESGATRASLPVTNEARLLQVSPASAAEDLIDVDAAERTFGRVIPSDEAQAEAGGGWVEDLGFERVSTESDGSAYGDLMVNEFEDAIGGTPSEASELLYFGGLPSSEPPVPEPAQTLMVTDANFAAPTRGLATSAAVDPSQLPPAGEDFAARFETEYGHPPGRYAAYGYEAMAVILDSVERASDPLDRSSVVEAFFATADRDSVLGTYSIDEEGNTTLDRMTGYELRGPAPPEPAAELTAR
jgi:branched-chain amino acid transport system substrate-binding protein